MTTGISTWRERADRLIGRCPTCDHYTWRDHCPGCESIGRATSELQSL